MHPAVDLSPGSDANQERVVNVEWLGTLKIDFTSWVCLPEEVRIAVGDPNLWHESKQDLGRWFTSRSRICHILATNPASDEMLRIVYPYQHKLKKSADDFFALSLSGQALRNRLEFCTRWMAENWLSNINGRKMVVVDLGGGSGSYGILSMQRARLDPALFGERFIWRCVDLDKAALGAGQGMAKAMQVSKAFRFDQHNFVKDDSRPASELLADYGVLIGVLCGMTPEEAVFCLERAKIHLKPKAELFAATLLTRAFEEDPCVFRVLSNVLNWHLRPKTELQVRDIFHRAGWKIQEVYSERDGGNGQYAIVHATI
ncbi:MAG: hypothetical protein ABH832_01335 [bacterium]